MPTSKTVKNLKPSAHVIRWARTPTAIRAFAEQYLLKYGKDILQAHPRNRRQLAAWFTASAIDAYGAPDVTEAARLITEEYEQLLLLRGKRGISQRQLARLLRAYAPIVRTAPSNTDTATIMIAVAARRQAALQGYGEAIRATYQPLFDLVELHPRASYDPVDIYAVFERCMDWLKAQDVRWSEWRLEMKPQASLSVNAEERTITVASQREAALPSEVVGLIAHELLVHALRGHNGAQTGDPALAATPPEAVDAEEGLGILTEEAVTGHFPEKARDRYIDIALALGVVDGQRVGRQRLSRLYYARQVIREQVAGRTVDRKRLRQRTQRHIDRICRFSVGSSLALAATPVSTRDCTYYKGYQRLADYVMQQIEQGVPAVELFRYLSSAKFDPTNPEHLSRLIAAYPTE